MRSQRMGLMGVAVLGLTLVPPLLVAGPTPEKTLPASQAIRDAQALAAKIDQLIEAGWQENEAKPSQPAEDAEFLRRVFLDVTGRIPPVSEVHAFLANKSPTKRLERVDDLVGRAGYVENNTHLWRALMIPQNNNQQVQFFAPQLEIWLRKQFRDNRPYDQMVRELLTAVVVPNPRGPQRGQPASAFEPTPAAFYQANELKPENLAASTSRLFLGVKLECAQCHDHPFAKWTKKQFWEYAAFFSGIEPQQARSPAREVPDRHTIKIPGTDKEVTARFLDGKEPAWKADASTRTVLAEWMTTAENPYFARNAVNRVWAHFFGIGLIEPVDEPGDDNPPSHPVLLELLAREFTDHKFDLKFLIRAITASRAYQLSSVATDAGQDDPRLFARMAVKGLTPEQLFDSLALATGYTEQDNPNQRFNPFGFNSPRAEFLAKFNNPSEKRTEHQTSILQALALMNGKFIADATSIERSRSLGAIAEMPWATTPGRIEALYLATLSRKPRPHEAERMLKYVETGGAAKTDQPTAEQKNTALADVLWVLLNSSEFIVNH